MKKYINWLYYILIFIGIIILLEGFLGVISSFAQGLSIILIGVVSLLSKRRINLKTKNLELALIIFVSLWVCVTIGLIYFHIIPDPFSKVILPIIMTLLAYDSWQKTNKLTKKS